MKRQACSVLVSSTVVLLLLSMMTIGATGTYPDPRAASSASRSPNCVPPTGVTILAPYSTGYEACQAGTIAGLPAGVGGIAFKQGDPNTLLVVTYTETEPAALYAVTVTRDQDGHIVSIPSGGTLFADTPYAGSGLAYGPGNVLFHSRRPADASAAFGEIKPGSPQTDKVVDLTPHGVTKSVSGLNFVPQGFPHEGELKLVTYQTSEWYSATLSPDAGGTYSIETIAKKGLITSYPRAFVYVPPSSPQFPDYSAMLAAEYYEGAVSAYPLDAQSDPILGARTIFLTGFSWPMGSAIDPVTHDLIVASYGGHVIAVRGFGSQPWVPTPTPTPTPKPPATYRITGRVVDAGGNPVREVTVELVGVYRGVTDSGGYYYFSQLPAGTYTLKPSRQYYSFTPAERTVTVPPDATVPDFVAQKSVTRPPVILVHGYLGAGLGGPSDECEYGVDHWDKAMFPDLFDDLPQWLVNDGLDVWIAHWDSGPLPATTWTIESNGECLAKEIAKVKELTGSRKVTLVAHSMGGLVSRAYLKSSTYATRQDVDKLITHGSPHGGIEGIQLLTVITGGLLGAFCIPQPAFCQMDPAYMRMFNNRPEPSIQYFVIGADGGSFLGNILYPLNGPNDGLVGLASGTGKYFSWFGNKYAMGPALRYQTHENHLREWGTWYFEPRPGETWSDSYKCVREILLNIARNDCVAAPQTLAGVQEQAGPYAFAPMQNGHISTGETINRALSIDATGRTSFALTWKAQTVSLSLVDPNGLTIDPTYAISHPESVTFDEGPAANGSPGWMTYTFPATVPGIWTLRVSAPDAGPDGTEWSVITSFESSRTLEAGTDTKPYRIGDTATLKATLKNGTSGIGGATVEVDLGRADKVTDKVTLTDMGGGEYQGTYTIPNAPGYLQATFTAHGSEGGTDFSRQATQLLSIMPQTGQLTGSYADRAVDEDADGGADALQVDVGLDIAKAGDYNLSADLQVGGQVVAQASQVLSATAGAQTVTLRFDGDDIYNARLDGPYLLTNLTLVDLQVAVPTIMQSDLYTTAVYHYDEFQAQKMLYLPMITR